MVYQSTSQTRRGSRPYHYTNEFHRHFVPARFRSSALCCWPISLAFHTVNCTYYMIMASATAELACASTQTFANHRQHCADLLNNTRLLRPLFFNSNFDPCQAYTLYIYCYCYQGNALQTKSGETWKLQSNQSNCSLRVWRRHRHDRRACLR